MPKKPGLCGCLHFVSTGQHKFTSYFSHVPQNTVRTIQALLHDIRRIIAEATGPGRKKEAQGEAPALYRECVEAKDERSTEDLKKDGWVKK
jgi:hypothetical protein